MYLITIPVNDRGDDLILTPLPDGIFLKKWLNADAISGDFSALADCAYANSELQIRFQKDGGSSHVTSGTLRKLVMTRGEKMTSVVYKLISQTPLDEGTVAENLFRVPRSIPWEDAIELELTLAIN
jgi:hypothetical protein